jgi:hypothetical protein
MVIRKHSISALEEEFPDITVRDGDGWMKGLYYHGVKRIPGWLILCFPRNFLAMISSDVVALRSIQDQFLISLLSLHAELYP